MKILLGAARWVGDIAGRIAVQLNLAMILADGLSPEQPDVYGACVLDEPEPVAAQPLPTWAHAVVPPAAPRDLSPYEIAEEQRQDEIRQLNDLYRAPAATREAR